MKTVWLDIENNIVVKEDIGLKVSTMVTSGDKITFDNNMYIIQCKHYDFECKEFIQVLTIEMTKI